MRDGRPSIVFNVQVNHETKGRLEHLTYQSLLVLLARACDAPVTQKSSRWMPCREMAVMLVEFATHTTGSSVAEDESPATFPILLHLTVPLPETKSSSSYTTMLNMYFKDTGLALSLIHISEPTRPY